MHDRLISAYPLFFNDTAPPAIYPLSLHDALPILTAEMARTGRPSSVSSRCRTSCASVSSALLSAMISLLSVSCWPRSEEHTSELQSRRDLVCRLLLEKKKTKGSAPSADWSVWCGW